MDILDRVIDYTELAADGRLNCIIQSTPLSTENEAVTMMLLKSAAKKDYFCGKLNKFSIKIQVKSESAKKAYDTVFLICGIMEKAKDIVSEDGSFLFSHAQVSSNPYFYQMHTNQTYIYEAVVDVFADCY